MRNPNFKIIVLILSSVFTFSCGNCDDDIADEQQNTPQHSAKSIDTLNLKK